MSSVTRSCSDGLLTVGRRILTLALLDGDIINGDVSLDARASDALHHHLEIERGVRLIS